MGAELFLIWMLLVLAILAAMAMAVAIRFVPWMAAVILRAVWLRLRDRAAIWMLLGMMRIGVLMRKMMLWRRLVLEH